MREKQSVASELEGALLNSSNLFPYFLLVALEAGGPLRAVVVLLFYPLCLLLNLAHLQNISLYLFVIISTAGLRVNNVKAVAKATLPRFFLEDLRESVFRVFVSCGGKKYVITTLPRVFVEPFLREYLDVDHVIGTELTVLASRWYAGLVAQPGFMSGDRRLQALMMARADDRSIDIGLAAECKDHSFLLLCKEHRFVSTQEKRETLLKKDYPKPLIFHDGRLVGRPDPLNFLCILLWLPLGILLAVTRVLVGIVLPYKLVLLCTALDGFRLRAEFPETREETNPGTLIDARDRKGTLYVCNHQTLLDPVVLSTIILRRASAVTYSLSNFSELISPIPTVRLTRDKLKDREIMQLMLERGDLVVCPEGTTCREPYLLRFSPLFAEVADKIVPVAVRATGSMFYGTTVRGYKWLDSLFYLMNPFPRYHLGFLEPVPGRPNSSSSNYDIANHIQGLMGWYLGFKCTNLTRKDKYRMIAGNDGVDKRS